MKRIVILCDGTWGAAEAPDPTNVVRLGQALSPMGSGGPPGDDRMSQVPIYIEGVGTGRRGTTRLASLLDRFIGGVFGIGLMANVVEAYRHLVFLYEPGDEVYVFGYSRGAFTARSLVGFIRFTGLLARADLDLLPEAVARYSERRIETPERRQSRNAEWRALHSPHIMTDPADAAIYAEMESHTAVPFDVAFLGVWDTVGRLGVPGLFTASPVSNRHAFHDTSLTTMVRAARHAVSIDERRRPFAPTLWRNIDDLNADRPDRPYREEHFAGDHGAVGGGGEIQDLSALTLAWMMAGAGGEGLEFDPRVSAAIAAAGDPLGSLVNSATSDGGFFARLLRRFGGPRDPVRAFRDVSGPARTRWGGDTGYRPEPLRPLEPYLNNWTQANPPT